VPTDTPVGRSQNLTVLSSEALASLKPSSDHLTARAAAVWPPVQCKMPVVQLCSALLYEYTVALSCSVCLKFIGMDVAVLTEGSEQSFASSISNYDSTTVISSCYQTAIVPAALTILWHTGQTRVIYHVIWWRQKKHSLVMMLECRCCLPEHATVSATIEPADSPQLSSSNTTAQRHMCATRHC
jgi:hypothetical protein